MNLLNCFNGGLGTNMRKAAHPSGSKGSSNPHRWSGSNAEGWCIRGYLFFVCGFWLVNHQSDSLYLRFRGVTKLASQACAIPNAGAAATSTFAEGTCTAAAAMTAEAIHALAAGNVDKDDSAAAVIAVTAKKALLYPSAGIIPHKAPTIPQSEPSLHKAPTLKQYHSGHYHGCQPLQ